MNINIEDIRKGDELLIGGNSKLRYIRVLETPRLSKKLDYYGKPKYMSVKLSTIEHINSITRSYKDYTGQIKSYVVKNKEWPLTGEGHNKFYSQNLNGKTFWLIKRAEEELN